MSGRGRGRGRGRGSGPLSQSKLLLKRSAQEAGLDNDREMMSIQEIVRPSLYPDILWQSSGNDAAHPTSSNPFVIKEEETEESGQAQQIVIAKRPATVVSMIQKQRQLFEALNKSSHFVQQNPMTDVARYGQQTIRTAPDQNVLLSMSGHQGINPMSSNELNENETEVPVTITSASIERQKVYSKLATDERYFPAELLSTRKQLESAREARNPQRKTLTDLLAEEEKIQATEEQLQEEDEEIGEELEDMDEEEVEDYTTNYYDSDNDVSVDGDGEATF
ncbi:hypothetical protein FisN_5Hh309 [Fistulifera solaris]|uniref:DNA-directed RNA polymerase III subunit n=1 Tax=Fistulifera solaris TaxID=1519565 RepID=A0A1Z5JSV0_FISSO|nr:hypothetical protein FisN_5Hh309 [Fistulifera solaris]|eukprot:GAX16932.1 hypothetical protein FisN_5Hh309 [Fistulifera solaris]